MCPLPTWPVSHKRHHWHTVVVMLVVTDKTQHLLAAVSPTKWINSAKAQTMYKLFLGKNVIQPTRNLAWSKRFLLERLWNGRHWHTPFPRHPCEVLGEFLLVNWCHRPISLKTTVSHIARPHRMRTTVYVCPSTYYSAILMCYKQIWIELQVSI